MAATDVTPFPTVEDPPSDTGLAAPVTVLVRRDVAALLAELTEAAVAYGTARGHADAARTAFHDTAPGSKARRRARESYTRAADREARLFEQAAAAQAAIEAAVARLAAAAGTPAVPELPPLRVA